MITLKLTEQDYRNNMAAFMDLQEAVGDDIDIQFVEQMLAEVIPGEVTMRVIRIEQRKDGRYDVYWNDDTKTIVDKNNIGLYQSD